MLSAVLWLLLASVAMTEEAVAAVDPDVLWAVLGGTAFGRVWQVRLILAAAAVALTLPRRSADRRWLLMLAALQLASLGLIGHAAMEEGVAGFFQRTVQAVHLLAGGAWIGALPSLMILLAATRRGEVPGEPAAALRRFSGIGTVAVVSLLLSGALNVWVRTDGRLGGPYGMFIEIKLALVAGMIGLALVNRFVLTPAMPHSPKRSHYWLCVSLGAETILGLMVVAVAFVLGNTAPP